MNGLRQIVSYYKFHTGQSQWSGSCCSVTVFVCLYEDLRILHKIHSIETRDQSSDPEHSLNICRYVQICKSVLKRLCTK